MGGRGSGPENATPRLALESAHAGALARLRIEIPPVNVLDGAALGELAECVARARGARVLLLTGLPRAFSAGVEIAEHAPEPEMIDRMLAAMRHAVAALLETPAVTVASVSGACLGGGAELASACDLMLVAEDARIGFPEIRLACFPPAGSVLLPLRIGGARAAEWILTGEVVSGRHAADAGFASRAVPGDALGRETDRLVESLLEKSGPALAGALEVLRAARREALQTALGRAEAAYRKLAGDEELARAVREFRRSR